MAIKTPETIKTPVEQPESKIAKTITRELPIDLSDEPDTMQVEFTDEQLANSFAASPTKPSQKTPTIDENKPIDEIQREVADYEQQRSGKLEYKDLLKQAEFFINIFDTGLSTIFNFIAQGGNSTDYKMLPSDKKLLTEQLALILAKYQSKFKIEYTFLMGIVIMYAPMTIAAFKNRKSNKKPRQSQQTIASETTKREPAKFGEPHYKKKDDVVEPIVEQPIVTPLEKIDIPLSPPSTQNDETKFKTPREIEKENRRQRDLKRKQKQQQSSF